MANQIKWQDKIQFGVGDTIKVSLAVKEGQKTRTQLFQGIVIAIRGTGEGKNFIVRKIAAGAVGVEKILPINTPTITGIEVVKKGKVRRAKLYFLRNLIGKKATKVKGAFVKKGQKVILDVPVDISEESIVSNESKTEKVRPEAVKIKNAPIQKEAKPKKIKKGPKKIVRKERVFVR